MTDETTPQTPAPVGYWLRAVGALLRSGAVHSPREFRERVEAAASADDLATTSRTLEAIARELGWDDSYGMPRPGEFGHPGGPRGHRFGPGFGPGADSDAPHGFGPRAGFPPFGRGRGFRPFAGGNRHRGFGPGAHRRFGEDLGRGECAAHAGHHGHGERGDRRPDAQGARDAASDDRG
ncbi:MAG: hypothetical protein ABT08_09910 [Microbacterium sp. SCN 71-21]|uniref:hypothetical protein n=1 Tax=Microbacterium sp. SCN 71-21 TaxID=1660116 RepID=UPI00086C9F47|nr:hypothetical protein [Microbacterium sp. SCN 71-21]ODU76249.1 MAG: hypothetical protein ABT08_09910 [Microbacterium sp. SCN 71-21]